MFGFIENLYRNPPAGSVCYDPKIHRYINCISGLPREIGATFLILAAVACVAVFAGLVIDLLRG